MLVRAIITYIALALSLLANAWLVVGRMGEDERTTQTCNLRAAEASVEVLKNRVGVLDWLLVQTAADQAATLARLDAVAERARERDVRWLQADVPTPACGPGQAFIDATNATLGHGQ
jgi:hypothetical protein